MSRLKDVFAHPYAPAWGGRIARDEEPQPAGSLLPAATEQLLSWAASYWVQADPAEFEWAHAKMRVLHKQSGVVYKIRIGMPFGGEHASGVSMFCVRDGKLVLLQDKPDRISTVVHGTFDQVARKVEHVAGPPEEGQDVGRIY